MISPPQAPNLGASRFSPCGSGCRCMADCPPEWEDRNVLITICARHMELTEALTIYIKSKVGKLPASSTDCNNLQSQSNVHPLVITSKFDLMSKDMRTSFATIDTATSTHAWISQSITERGYCPNTRIEFDIIDHKTLRLASRYDRLR